MSQLRKGEPLPGRGRREVLAEHLNEVLLAIAVLMLALPVLETVAARRSSAVPGVYFAWFALFVAVLAWLLVLRPGRMGAALCGDRLVVANYWRSHTLRLSDLAEVRCTRGRTAWPLIELVTLDRQSVVVESADFRSVDQIATMLQTPPSPDLKMEPASDDPLSELYGYNSAGVMTQTKDFVRSVRDGSWFRRQIRIY